jgi:hypothetical protein
MPSGAPPGRWSRPSSGWKDWWQGLPKATKPEKEAKRRTVAKGVVAGKPTRAIAKKAGCTTRHVERLANEPETQFLITDALRPHHKKLAKLAGKAITAVTTALGAKRSDSADHVVRLRAIERYGDLLEFAQGKPKESQESDGAQFTWEEFVLLYRRKTTDAGDPAKPPLVE